MADGHTTQNFTQKYIRDVENCLGDLAPAQRAAIIIRLDAQLGKVAVGSYEQIVAALGSPSQAANLFRLDHGKNPFDQSTTSIISQEYQASQSKPVGSSLRRFFKYATIAVLTMFALFVASIFLIPLMIFKFIAVDNFEKDFTFTFGDSKSRSERFQGKLSALPLNNFTMSMSNGQINIIADPNATEIVYECEIESASSVNQAEAAKVDNGHANLTLLNVESADCDLTIPSKLPISINLTSGKIALTEMEQNVEANLTNGEIEFASDDKSSFQMNANVQTGSVDGLKAFEANQKNKKGPQYSAVLSVGNGRIDIE